MLLDIALMFRYLPLLLRIWSLYELTYMNKKRDNDNTDNVFPHPYEITEESI